MGYSTCGSCGRRTCDGCDRCPCHMTHKDGKPVPLRRLNCEHGWCGPWRFCADCWKKYAAEQREQCRTVCARSSARFTREREAQRLATEAGKTVIKAGVNCGEGLVHAWTTTGEYLVPTNDYHAALEREDKVLENLTLAPWKPEYAKEARP